VIHLARLTGEIKEAEKLIELKKKINQLDALNKITTELKKTNDLDSLLNKINIFAAELVNAEAASILLLNKKENVLTFKSSLGKKSKEIKKYKVKMGQGIAGWVAETGKSIIVNDVSKDVKWNNFFDKATEFVTKSMICVPLMKEGKMLGVMETINKKNNRLFNEEDKEILHSFANQVVIALNNTNIINDLNNYFRNTMEIMIMAMENRPVARNGHHMDIARYATEIGRVLGIRGEEYRNLYYASLLHDIGKVKMSMNIYSKNIKHSVIGANMLKQIKLFEGVSPIVKHQYENYDGSGFPSGLVGENIPLGSRIISLVEDYVKINYNKKLEGPKEYNKKIEKLFSLSGKKYDPRVLNALKEIIRI